VTNQELLGSASKVPEWEKEKLIIVSACLWNPHGTDHHQAFFPICLQIKITNCYHINKPLIAAPWNTCPFPTDNLVVISNIKVLYMFIIYIFLKLQHFKVVCPI
jgi:hypothetical protein